MKKFVISVVFLGIFTLSFSGCTSTEKPQPTVIRADGKVLKNVPICEGDNRKDCFHKPKSKADCLKGINPAFKAMCDMYE